MRICEIIANKKYKRILKTIADKQGAIDFWWSSELEDGRQNMNNRKCFGKFFCY